MLLTVLEIQFRESHAKLWIEEKIVLNYGDLEMIAHFIASLFCSNCTSSVVTIVCIFCSSFFAIIFSTRNDCKTVLSEANLSSEVI